MRTKCECLNPEPVMGMAVIDTNPPIHSYFCRICGNWCYSKLEGDETVGEIAEMMLDGILCESCGTFLGESAGHPRYCAGCEPPPQKKVSEKTNCPICKKLVKKVGLAQHMQDAHGSKPAQAVRLWRIWSNEHKAWWAPAGNGYTNSKSAAGMYTFEAATEIVWNANHHRGDTDAPEETMVPVEVR